MTRRLTHEKTFVLNVRFPDLSVILRRDKTLYQGHGKWSDREGCQQREAAAQTGGGVNQPGRMPEFGYQRGDSVETEYRVAPRSL
jgi:hypothetical protein